MINRSFEVFPAQECFEPEDPDDKLRDAYVRGMLDMQDRLSNSKENTRSRRKKTPTAIGSIFVCGILLGVLLGRLSTYRFTGIL